MTPRNLHFLSPVFTLMNTFIFY